MRFAGPMGASSGTLDGPGKSEARPAVLVTPNGMAIRIQLLRETGYAPWPTELRQIEQRYRDALPAILRVPTLPSFAGWKTATWIDRHAARDLYDLWALSKVGALAVGGGVAGRIGWSDEAHRFGR